MKELNVMCNNENGELIVREGEALKLMPPNKIKINGDIHAVSNFLGKRTATHAGAGMQEVNTNKAIIITDRKELTISLLLDPENYYGAEVIGTLEESDELKSFCINTVKTFKKDEFVKLLKFSKIYFAQPEKHSELMHSLMKIQSSVNIRSTDGSDERGNKERNFIKEVTTDIPNEFVLDIPIFKGFGPVKFRVDICLDVTEGSIRFWLESVELYEFKQKETDRIFLNELGAAKNFVVINK